MSVDAIQASNNWINRVVIADNLCPFAKKEMVKNTVHFQLSQAHTPQDLLHDLANELERIINTPAIETSLLIHPHVLNKFDEFNQFLSVADAFLEQLKLDGVIQIASFHPDFCFADCANDDPSNYTNRSPYPMLHLLREDSVEQAIVHYPNPEHIPLNNIAKLKKLGLKECQQRLANCIDTK